MNNNWHLMVFVSIMTSLVFISQAHAKPAEDQHIYLPIIITPPFIVADFDADVCQKAPNNLGGEMGSAFDPNTSDKLTETYVPEVGRGCIVKLDYQIPDKWSAFWLKLLDADLTPYSTLSFDVRFEGVIDSNTDMEIKVELKRGCHDQECDEVWIHYVPGIIDSWQTRTLSLADFYSPIDGTPPPPLIDMEELVFTFEKEHISSKGIVSLDYIIFEP